MLALRNPQPNVHCRRGRQKAVVATSDAASSVSRSTSGDLLGRARRLSLKLSPLACRPIGFSPAPRRVGRIAPATPLSPIAGRTRPSPERACYLCSCRHRSAYTATVASAGVGERDRAAELALTIQIVAKHSRGAGAADEPCVANAITRREVARRAKRSRGPRHPDALGWARALVVDTWRRWAPISRRTRLPLATDPQEQVALSAHAKTLTCADEMPRQWQMRAARRGNPMIPELSARRS